MRTVISVEPGGPEQPGLRVRLALAPFHIPDAKTPATVDLSPDQLASVWGQPHAVQAYGTELATKLKAHPGVQQVLQSAWLAPAGTRWPIYFQMFDSQTQRIHWESLCAPGGQFLALDPRWPFGRIAEMEVDRPKAHLYDPPLRLMALVSAAGVSPEPEWSALVSAVESARGHGLRVTLRALVGNEDLHDKIAQEVGQGTLRDVAVAPMPANGIGVLDEIAAFRPHLLHAFCHGFAPSGLAELRFATFQDEVVGDPSGSTVLRVDELEEVASRPGVNLWLVTLNCCQGAAAGSAPALAHALVARAGIPAVVGMAEPIAASDAHTFCEGLYAAIFRLLAPRLAPGAANQQVEVEWAEALQRARVALRDQHGSAADAREWLLPVLYVRPEAFHLTVLAALAPGVAPALAPEELATLQRQAAMVAGLLASLPPDAPEQLRQRLVEMVKDLPPLLRPDRSGNFPAGS